ncbi:hypothetical protein [Nocardiopsis sp. FIRDI 009]|uniref:hypothetical protein n=1 Tax=Nocardiopsis sp. FIRDI 009 TaxID=714197 RepID=UPI000E23FCCD|nr:hypothetical protein [Nocardiopsis sp. FIRDI 009]
MAKATDGKVVAWPTLFVAIDWVEAHCVIPDGFHRGEPFELTDEMLWFFANHYRVRRDADVSRSLNSPASAFFYRRSQLVRPQKWGKGPLTAAQILAEAVGPVVFAGYARGGEAYRCAEQGCGCGWDYEYEPGEAMGIPWPTPLIQVTAFSEDQTGNIYDALRPMIKLGPLAEMIPKVGEEFTRLPNGGEIVTVTSNAQSRLGQRVTFVAQDETGIWTADNRMVKVAETQRRGLAGMGGRAVETKQLCALLLTVETGPCDLGALRGSLPRSLPVSGMEGKWSMPEAAVCPRPCDASPAPEAEPSARVADASPVTGAHTSGGAR